MCHRGGNREEHPKVSLSSSCVVSVQGDASNVHKGMFLICILQVC